jgi:hypothetical protein
VRPAGTAALAALLVLFGCAPLPLSGSPPHPAPPPAAAAPPAATPAPVPSPAPPSAPRPDVSLRDQCGAAPVQRLVGHPRTEIPVPLDPSRQRVACTTCPVTLDYNPARLNFFFDAQTGIIREVRCG